GGGSVRENIGVRCLARYTQNTWKMQAGDVPLPPSPSVPRRGQCIASRGGSETQGPLVDLEQGGGPALGGGVSPCPEGMPGIAAQAYPVIRPGVGRDAPLSQGDSEQAFDITQVPLVITSGAGPVRAVKLAEAVASGLFVSIAAARKAAHRQGWKPVGGDR